MLGLVFETLKKHFIRTMRPLHHDLHKMGTEHFYFTNLNVLTLIINWNAMISVNTWLLSMQANSRTYENQLSYPVTINDMDRAVLHLKGIGKFPDGNQ